jgi:hypothetical protein
VSQTVRTPSLLSRSTLVLFTVLVLTLGVSLAVPAAPATAAASDTATIVQQTNAARAKKGLPALTRNAAMDKVAQAWAVKMATSGYKHNPNYSTQIPTGWRAASENIAWNYTSATVVKAWLDSPGHYANIMRAGTDIGMGYYVDPKGGGTFFVQNFAQYPTLTASPTPKVSGRPLVGQTLTATAGTWSPAPVTLSYQWKRAGVVITGATARTYVVRPTDVDASLTVTVTGTKKSVSTVRRQSAGTAKTVGLVYRSCALLNAKYPSGVAKAGVAQDKVKGVKRPFKGTPYSSTALYQLNKARDGDSDGIACEK